MEPSYSGTSLAPGRERREPLLGCSGTEQTDVISGHAGIRGRLRTVVTGWEPLANAIKERLGVSAIPRVSRDGVSLSSDAIRTLHLLLHLLEGFFPTCPQASLLLF